MRRLEAHDAPTFLINKNRHIDIANNFAQLIVQRLDMLQIRDITGKQDKAIGISFTKEALFPIA